MQNNTSSAVNQNSETNKKEDKNFSASSQQKGTRYGSNESAQGPIDRPPCLHCKQETPTHSPTKCWKNPNGPHFRPDYRQKQKVKRIFSQSDSIQGAINLEHIPSIANEMLNSKTDLNSQNFDIQDLFVEESNTVQMLKEDEKKGVIQNCLTTLSHIPKSRKINLEVGGVNVVSILDTGADITVLNPDTVNFTEGVDCEIVGKITLEAAFGNSTVADLAIITARIVNGTLTYPPVSIQVALTPLLKGPALLSLDDFNLLSEQTFVAIPQIQRGGPRLRRYSEIGIDTKCHKHVTKNPGVG